MSRPVRNSSSHQVPHHRRTFFATTKTAMGKCILQSDRNAKLLIDVLRSLVTERRFQIGDFVIMPDHVHLLITVDGEMTIEKSMQLIKGRFSYRLKKEYGYLGEVWQARFSEVRVDDEKSYLQHREYIAGNPVRAGLIDSAELYPYCYTFLARKVSRG
jgi:putative transposase